MSKPLPKFLEKYVTQPHNSFFAKIYPNQVDRVRSILLMLGCSNPKELMPNEESHNIVYIDIAKLNNELERIDEERKRREMHNAGM